MRLQMTSARLVKRDGQWSVEVKQEWHDISGESALELAASRIVELGARDAGWNVFFTLSSTYSGFYDLVDQYVHDGAAERCLNRLAGQARERNEREAD